MLNDPTVAPTHASLELDTSGTAILQDLAEGGGLHVNGQPIDGPIALRGSEAVQIGATVIWTSFREPTGTAATSQGTVVGEYPASLWIVVCSGPDSGVWHGISGSTFVVGRGSDCDLTLADDRVSRRHATFSIDDRGRAHLRDLGSSNGTIVNGRRLKPQVGFTGHREVELDGNDLVQFGDTLIWVTRDQPSRAG